MPRRAVLGESRFRAAVVHNAPRPVAVSRRRSTYTCPSCRRRHHHARCREYPASTADSWSKEGTARHRQSKEASILWSQMRKQGSCLEKEIMQGTMPGARRRGRPRTAWMDNIKTWTGLPVEESIRMTEEREYLFASQYNTNVQK